MPNKENINKVIEVIRDRHNHFDMSIYSTRLYRVGGDDGVCDTPSCICGWANELNGSSKAIALREEAVSDFNMIKFYRNHNLANDFLGIDSNMGMYLFSSENAMLVFEDRLIAIRCLEILRDEGVVDWERARIEAYANN